MEFRAKIDGDIGELIKKMAQDVGKVLGIDVRRDYLERLASGASSSICVIGYGYVSFSQGGEYMIGKSHLFPTEKRDALRQLGYQISEDHSTT